MRCERTNTCPEQFDRHDYHDCSRSVLVARVGLQPSVRFKTPPFIDDKMAHTKRTTSLAQEAKAT